MTGVYTYQPPGCVPPVLAFVDGADPKQRDKLIRLLMALPGTPRSALREPHFKHFALERYRDLYELRSRGKVLVRIIFIIRPDGSIVLLHAFVKRRSRDTMQALEQSLRILAQIRDHPDRAVEFKVKEEK